MIKYFITDRAMGSLNDNEKITVTDLVNKMKECCGDLAYSQKYIKKKLQEHFDLSTIITNINGKHNVVTRRYK